MRRNNALRSILTAVLFSTAVFVHAQGRFVLVVDDLGNQWASGVAVIDSPWVTTLAIMPKRPYTQKLADYAHQSGKEIIVHAPMSNLIDFPLGPLGLDRRDGEAQLKANVSEALASVPHAIGLSNHMGSRLTQDPQAMGWVMQRLKLDDVYFFDSRTVATSIAGEVAERYQVPWATRDIFLDHQQDDAFLNRQWSKAWADVYAGKTVIVIGHPYPETIRFLQAQSMSSAQARALTPLSSLLRYPVASDRMTATFRP